MHMSLNKEYFDELSNQNLIIANEVNKKLYLEKKNASYEKILIWANENKDIINNCPKNKIKNTFQPLLDLLDIKTLTCNDIENIKIDYAAWWYSCMPVQSLKKNRLSNAFFYTWR